MKVIALNNLRFNNRLSSTVSEQTTSKTAEIVVLKQDWDYTPHIGKQWGHHAVRKKEQELLVDFLTKK